MNEDKKPKRRLVLPEKTNQVEPLDVTVIPNITSLLNDAAAIIGAELAQYRSKTKRGISLDLKEARVIANYMDVLLRASKESREAARAEDLSELSDSELLQLATQLAKANPAPKVIKKESDEEE